MRMDIRRKFETVRDVKRLSDSDRALNLTSGEQSKISNYSYDILVDPL